MEQKDYLMREVEKIGLVLRAILNSLLGQKENLAITIESNFEQTKEILINETGLDLDNFISLDSSATKEYISSFNGFRIGNLELLADILFQLEKNEELDKRKSILEKAVILYELCNETDKTFSFDREQKIELLKKRL